MKNIVNIKGRDYKIIKTTKDITSKGELCDGVSDSLNKTIYIKLQDNTEYVLQTIIHELIHANYFECGLYGEMDSEQLPRWFEVQFFQIVKQFLKIAKYIYPTKTHDADKIDSLLNKLFEVDKNEIHT